jgi:tRNA (guanine6-N2)-methyltransferase
MITLAARCVRGLEWVLAAEVAEVAQLGTAPGLHLSERQVAFGVDALDATLLGLRTADDLLLELGVLGGVGHTRAALADLARGLSRIDLDAGIGRLEELRALPAKPGFDVVASLLGKRNYNRFAVEDAAGEAIQDALGAQYVSRNPHEEVTHAGDTAETDFTVRIALSGDTAEISLRLPRRPLHRRAWKLDTGPGTLHPPLAAALVRIGSADCAGDTAVLDPFCGDGTIAIEAALAHPDAVVLAADLDEGRLANARANAARADVASRVAFVQADAGRGDWDGAAFGLVATNPPWNRAVGAAGALADSIDPFWRRVPGSLRPGGRICTVADAELDVPGHLRGAGYTVTLAQTIRLAGRVSQVVLATPPGAPAASLSPGLAAWHARAVAAGIVSTDGF